MAKDKYQELLELREIVKEQKQQIEKLQFHVENLTQAILHSQKKLFGSSSEKTSGEGQISLFNGAEDSANSSAVEPTFQNIIVSTHKRTPRKIGSKEELNYRLLYLLHGNDVEVYPVLHSLEVYW